MRNSVIDQHISNVYSSIENKGIEKNVVISSWKRCIETFKLDPLSRQPSRVLTHSELQNHTYPIEEFITTAREGMRTLYAQVQALDYVVLLCDRKGVTVDYIGNDRLNKELRNSGLYLGADWNERHAGTCAVGTLINEYEPMTIHQQDHFDIVNTTLTCSASPILDHDGQLLAVLDVSALHSPKEKSSQHLLLKLVQMHARFIESAHFLNYYREHTILKFDINVCTLSTNCPNLIALDKHNVIVGANQNARKIMARELGIKDITSQLLTGFEFTSLFELSKSEDAASFDYYLFKSRNTGLSFFCDIQAPKTKNKRLFNPAPNTIHDPVNIVAAEIDKLAGHDPSMHKVKQLANKFSPTDINILIRGETGTGKEVLAKAIHDSSKRSDGPFIAVNCAALPDSLIESELFGYKSGSFTGANSKGKSGLILAADQGTLFLDEIGDMPSSLQTRLLRVLAEKEVTPIGSDKPIKVNFRLISATHQEVAPQNIPNKNDFRADLYHRLNGATINLPPLRDRQDIYYLISKLMGKKSDMNLSKSSLEVLTEYAWPGNIRELKNVINYASTLCDEEGIRSEHLPDYVFTRDPFIVNEHSYSPTRHVETLSEEGQELLLTLRNNNWNATASAKKLNIGRATLYRKMKKFNIISPNNTDLTY